MSRLPEPSTEELAISQALSAHIAQAIELADGCLSFERYMELVLYTPRLGYYNNSQRKFGRQGDFVTAPMLGDTLARAIVNQFGEWADQAQLPPCVMEFGAGNGQLAADILRLWSETRPGQPPLRYQILELSADLVEQQRACLEAQVPWALTQVQWLTEMPAQIDGLVVGNEVLDAMPCISWEKSSISAGTPWLARGVEIAANGFRWSHRPADESLVRALNELELQRGEPFAEGYQSELQSQAQAWLSSLSAHLGRAVVLLLDYGFDAGQYYAQARNTGTLMCHYRHHAHEDPFFLPGLQDVTTHVDFSAVWQAGTCAGLDLLGYVNQAHFLMGAQALREAPPQASPIEAAQHHQHIFRLTSESEMGELFKVIAFSKNLPILLEAPSMAFVRGDRSGWL